VRTRDHGDVAMQTECGFERCAWFAGNTLLNAQAMHDLINDGWVRLSPRTWHAVIDAWPSFADHSTEKEKANG
jgi:hypothetical protein